MALAPASEASRVKSNEQARDEDRRSENAAGGRGRPAKQPEAGGALAGASTAKLRRGSLDGLDKEEKDDSETRVVAGRRFRQDGGIWIDTAFEGPRATTNLSRGSEQYRALIADEPGIKTVADQLDGEFIIVWKGRAYRIR